MITATMTPTGSGNPATVLNVGDVQIVLDTICPTCNGKSGAAHKTVCPPCKSTGFVPSPEGRRLLAFIKKHLGLS